MHCSLRRQLRESNGEDVNTQIIPHPSLQKAPKTPHYGECCFHACKVRLFLTCIKRGKKTNQTKKWKAQDNHTQMTILNEVRSAEFLYLIIERLVASPNCWDNSLPSKFSARSACWRAWAKTEHWKQHESRRQTCSVTEWPFPAAAALSSTLTAQQGCTPPLLPAGQEHFQLTPLPHLWHRHGLWHTVCVQCSAVSMPCDVTDILPFE